MVLSVLLGVAVAVGGVYVYKHYNLAAKVKAVKAEALGFEAYLKGLEAKAKAELAKVESGAVADYRVVEQYVSALELRLKAIKAAL